MKSQLTASERFEAEKLRQGFEACSELLDRYFEPWLSRAYHALSRQPEKQNARLDLLRITSLAVSILILFASVLYLSANAVSRNRREAQVYSRPDNPALIAAYDEDDTVSVRLQKADELISINTASANELRALPGIGPVIAQRIIEEREQHGSFHYAEDLLSVPGIGDKTLSRIAPFLYFDTEITEIP